MMASLRLFRARPDGFTLLEVIIAFVILALMLGTVFNTFSIGLRNANLAGDYAGAVVHAEAKLGLLGVAEPLEVSASNGRFDRLYGWRQSIRPVLQPDESSASKNSPQLYEVILTVFWGNGAEARELTLRTLRMKYETGA